MLFAFQAWIENVRSLELLRSLILTVLRQKLLTVIEDLHDHVTAAILDDRNNKIFKHENELNSSGEFERDFIFLPSNVAVFT
jgi:hypothetical protein